MNGASDHSQTDWLRLKAMGDADIDKAISEDKDAYLLSDTEMLGRDGASYRYELLKISAGSWGWRLLDGKGEAIALSNASFRSRELALAAVSDLRRAVLGGMAKAA